MFIHRNGDFFLTIWVMQDMTQFSQFIYINAHREVFLNHLFYFHCSGNSRYISIMFKCNINIIRIRMVQTNTMISSEDTTINNQRKLNQG